MLKWTKTFLLDLIFPIQCLGCRRFGRYLCDTCQARLQAPIPRCGFCGKPSLFGKTHDECLAFAPGALSGLLVCADLRGSPVQSMVWHFKYNSVPDIGDDLARLMADFIFAGELSEFFSEFELAAVPLHPRRQKTRGYNQSAILAARLAPLLGLPVSDFLIKTKPTARQVDLERKQRLENVAGAFAVNKTADTSGKKILLIDDVATTGATLNECSKTLKQAGAAEVWGMVVARN